MFARRGRGKGVEVNVHRVHPCVESFRDVTCVCIVEFCLSESRREVNSSYNWTLRDSALPILAL